MKRRYNNGLPVLKNKSERFWQKVLKTPTCWNWIAYRRKRGKHVLEYGVFCYKSRVFPAHRIAWELSYGKIPENLCVLHKCDIPYCVNPEHLYLGTRTQNVIDMDKKGRRSASRGERHPCAKFTWNEIFQIRRDYSNGVGSHKKLAKIFKTSHSNIHRIVNQKTWKSRGALVKT